MRFAASVRLRERFDADTIIWRQDHIRVLSICHQIDRKLSFPEIKLAQTKIPDPDEKCSTLNVLECIPKRDPSTLQHDPVRNTPYKSEKEEKKKIS